MNKRFGISVIVLIALLMGATLPAAIAQDGAIPTTHVVQQGETLFRIGLKYGFSVEELALANGLSDPSVIYVGQVIKLPVPIGGGEEPLAASNSATTFTAEGVPADVAPYIIPPGQASVEAVQPVEAAPVEVAPVVETAPVEAAPVVQIPAEIVTPVEVNVGTGGEVVHLVQANEGLAGIAKQYGVSWTAIAAANNITDPNIIYPGQQLVIPDPTRQPPADYGQPAPVSDGSRSILVDLSDQTISAYENGALLKTVVVSTGLPGTPTVQGDYAIYSKLPEQAMSGPGYYLPGVPWVMYFYQGYAIHGTYWHNNFGHPMSHGCVNLPTPDAEWFYEFAAVGTPVKVVP